MRRRENPGPIDAGDVAQRLDRLERRPTARPAAGSRRGPRIDRGRWDDMTGNNGQFTVWYSTPFPTPPIVVAVDANNAEYGGYVVLADDPGFARYGFWGQAWGAWGDAPSGDRYVRLRRNSHAQVNWIAIET